MVVNATFNNISAISWLSALMVEETGVPGENHDLPQVSVNICHIQLDRVHLITDRTITQSLSCDVYWLHW
jgi:hypothetical protein